MVPHQLRLEGLVTCCLSLASLSLSLARSLSLALSLSLPACPILVTPGGRRGMPSRQSPGVKTVTCLDTGEQPPDGPVVPRQLGLETPALERRALRRPRPRVLGTPL